MSQQFNVSGTVASLTTRDIKARTGKMFQKHGVTLADGRSFEFPGFKQPHRVGDSINYTVEKNYGRYETVGAGAVAGLEDMPGVAASTPTVRGTGVASGGGSSYSKGDRVFPTPPASGEIAIIRQNALTNAVKLLGDALDDGWTLNEDGEAQIMARADLAIKLAYRFASFSSGHMDTKLLEEAAKLMPPSPEE